MDLLNGDEITVLSSRMDGVEESNKISFKIEIVSTGKRRRESGDSESSNSKRAKIDSDLSEEITCGICMELIHQCVTLMPCLHNVFRTVVLWGVLFRLVDEVEGMSSV